MNTVKNLKLKIVDGLLICEKPNGIATHAADHSKIGFVEWLEEKIGCRLYTYQRLDLATSGLISFALDSDTAAKMTELWAQHAVTKNYLFISDQPYSEKFFSVESHIVKENLPANSKTHFELLNKVGHYSLWRATPFSGKAHQIRLHAAKMGIPILGDSEHGGTDFFRLCLHSESLKIPDYGVFESLAPSFFYQLENLDDIFTCQLEDAFHRREMIYNDKPGCLRFLHNEIPELKIDLYENHWWIYDYELNLQQRNKVINFIAQKSKLPFYVREMKDRGQTPTHSELQNDAHAQESWIARENEMFFEMRSNQGLSPGLFLDQRENRKWVYENSRDKKVLNLFSYTGGFSVAAALGGAQSVTTVDLNKNFINWSKTNFKCNQLDPEKYEFWATDSRLFINGALKRNKKFDLIICDPPSFSRSKEGLFRIDKDANVLMELLFEILEKNGVLLFCTNYEKWTLQNLKDNISLLEKKSVKLLNPPFAGLDFELPGENAILKTLVLAKF